MSVNSATERILKLMNEAARNARKEKRILMKLMNER